jgi:hypothetical protein
MQVLLVYIMMVACMCDSVKVKSLYLDEELKLEMIREGQSNYYQLLGVEGGGMVSAQREASQHSTVYQPSFLTPPSSSISHFIPPSSKRKSPTPPPTQRTIS